MKKLTTAKIWQFAAGQFGWALLSGIISNWLVYFYQPDETASSQGQTVFIPQALVIFGVLTIIVGIKRRVPAAGTFHRAGVLVTGE